MPREDRQQLLEDVGVLEADPGFHRERDADRVAQGAENFIDPLRLAEQAAPGALAVNDRDGTAEIEVDRGDGMLFQFARGADERGDVVADHLRDHRAAGRVLRDRGEDVAVEPRIGQDAEVFREIDVGISVAADQPHERQVGDVLHRGEREDRLGLREEVLECFARAHGSWLTGCPSRRVGKRTATPKVTIVPKQIHQGNSMIGSHFGGT